MPENLIEKRKISPNGVRNQMGRLAWGLVQTTLFRLSPRPCHRWRIWLLKCFGARVCFSAHIYPGVKIWAPWNLEVGEIVGIADGVILYNQAKIILENYSVVSQEAFLCTASHDYTLPDFPLWHAPIVVKSGAWVAARAFVHPGVTIGERAVVGACAVVISDVPPHMVVAGNPSKIVKKIQ